MNAKFVEQWNARSAEVRAVFAVGHPADYRAVVKAVVGILKDGPDPERIHEIDDGDYQGTLVYVIGGRGYQPSEYWYVRVSYGSCSGCDTLQSIEGYSGQPPTEKQIDEYMTLALHIVQGLRAMSDDAL